MLSWRRPRGGKDGNARVHLVKPIFKFLTGDVDYLTYGGKFISQRMCNGEFYFWLVAEIIPWEEHGCKEEMGTYGLEVKVVSPSEAAGQPWRDAVDSCGWREEDMATLPMNDAHFRVEVLHSYGIGAIIWQENGDNIKELWRKMHKKLEPELGIWFGFTMDKAQNKIGSTGWDMLKGDSLAGLRRYSENDSDEKKLVRKMYKMPESLEDALQAAEDGSATLESEDE